MSTIQTRIFALIATVFLTACAVGDLPFDSETSAEREGPPNLAVSIGTLASDDTEFIKFRVFRCGGVTPVVEETQPLASFTIPGGIESLEKKPFDPASAHQFADKFFTLEPGCYDVQIVPLSASYGVSDCDPASKENVEVVDGETTEVLVLSQCIGEKYGYLDVIGSLNHPPIIKSLSFDPMKMVECPLEVTICAEVKDPDYDPLTLEWSILDGPPPVTQPQVISSTQQGNTLEECIRFEPGAGVWELQLLAFDEVWHQGQKMTYNDLYAMTGRLDSSEDVARFPLYGLGSECPGCDCKTAVQNLQYSVERGGQQLVVTSMSDLLEGDVVTPMFDIAPGCGPFELSFASYETSGPTFATSIPQSLFDFSTDYFADGGQSLDPVSIPACYFQADMVCGPVLGGDEINRGERYGDRKLDWVNGGTQSCAPSSGCTRTRGYWTNHNEFAFAPGLKIDWPAPYDEKDQLCGEDWLNAIDASKRPQTRFYQLAAQWIAATLNGANGADTSAVTADLASAESLLKANCATQTIPQADDATAETLKNALDAYNNGLTGPGKCD